MSHLLVKAQGERSNKCLAVLCNAMLDEFGGMQGFVESWREFYCRYNGGDQMRYLTAVLSLVRAAGSPR